MVQEKDAAQKRVAQRKEFERVRREAYNKSIIKTVYVVMETRPGYNTGGYYDTDVPAETHSVSPDFATKAEAEKWMDEHEADKGKFLWVGKRHLRKIELKEWTGVFRA